MVESDLTNITTPSDSSMQFVRSSHETLFHHRVGNLQKARDVGAVDIISRRTESLGSLEACRMNALHDPVEPLIDFLAGPRNSHSVLGHFQTGRCDSACLCGFA